jgi:hypothetical protein
MVKSSPTPGSEHSVIPLRYQERKGLDLDETAQTLHVFHLLAERAPADENARMDAAVRLPWLFVVVGIQEQGFLGNML